MTTRSAITAAAPLIERSEHNLRNSPASKKALATFAKSVRARRIELGFTLLTLKNQVGVSKSQMSHIECGDNWPAMAVYIRLCEVLKVGVPPLVAERKPKKKAVPL